MSRFTLGLAVVACLMLTAYFGAAAWRASDDPHMDITGSIGPAESESFSEFCKYHDGRRPAGHLAR